MIPYTDFHAEYNQVHPEFQTNPPYKNHISFHQVDSLKIRLPQTASNKYFLIQILLVGF